MGPATSKGPAALPPHSLPTVAQTVAASPRHNQQVVGCNNTFRRTSPRDLVPASNRAVYSGIMAIARVASSSPLVQRTCLRCGYRGDELQRLGELAAYRCPDCGQDLYARPPRSYAEMEGLIVESVGADHTPHASARHKVGPASRRPGWLRRVVGFVLSTFRRGPRPAASGPSVVSAKSSSRSSSLPR